MMKIYLYAVGKISQIIEKCWNVHLYYFCFDKFGAHIVDYSDQNQIVDE